MAKIALMSVPLHGHVHPMLGLAAELVARGHAVTFATGTDHRELVAATGAVPVTYHSTIRSTRTGAGRWTSAEDVARQSVGVFESERTIALTALSGAYGCVGLPEIVVHDQVTGAAPVLAERWGVPTVQFSPTHVLPTSQPSFGGAVEASVPCIVAIPRSLQFPVGEVRPEWQFVGPLDWVRPGGDSDLADATRPTVLISLGTTFNDDTELMRTAARAASEVLPGHRTIVALGRPMRADDVVGWPPSTSVVPWVHQQSILRSSDLFVTAGGTGSVLEAVRRHVRLVVLPQVMEQVMTAHQVDMLGLGTAVSRSGLTPASLADAMTASLTLADHAAAVRRIIDEIHRSGGSDAAADVVENAIPHRGGRQK